MSHVALHVDIPPPVRKGTTHRQKSSSELVGRAAAHVEMRGLCLCRALVGRRARESPGKQWSMHAIGSAVLNPQSLQPAHFFTPCSPLHLDSMRDDAAQHASVENQGASARLDAIAKLRRAASQREVRQAKPPPTTATTAATHAGTADSVSSNAEAQLVERNAARPDGQFPLLSLEQLRQRLVQERKPTGMSRSASTSAASQVARAYTMQKLLGASTPISYNDMFAFVRNASQMRDAPSSSKDRPLPDRAIETPRRTTLIRSVSARDHSRVHAYKQAARAPLPSPTSAQAVSSPTWDDRSSVAHDSSSTSSWRLSLYDYDSTSPVVSQTSALAPVSSTPSIPTTASVSAEPPIKTAEAPSHLPAKPQQSEPRELDKSAHLFMTRNRSHSSSSATVTRVTAHTPHVDTQLPRSVKNSSDIPRETVPANPMPKTPAPTYPSSVSVSFSHEPAPASAPVFTMAGHADDAQKPLPHLPSAMSQMLEESLGLGHPSSSPSVDAAHAAEASSHVRSNSASAATTDTRKDSKVARIFGSIRRKSSRRGLGSLRRPSKASNDSASTSSPVASHTLMASVILQKEVQDAWLHDTVITIPTTPAALMRWNQKLPRPVRHVLAPFPAQVPLEVALDPPRRLVRILPLLQSAGDEYVKLRYLFLFQDTAVLAKPMIAPMQGESLSDLIIRKLGCAPDLSESCTPITVLGLRDLYVDDSRQGKLSELAMLVQRREAQLYAHPFETLHVLRMEAQLPGSEAYAHAQLLYAGASLDRMAVAQYLYAHRDVMKHYVMMHCVTGAPIELALRSLLSSVPWPQDFGTFEALLSAFAVHWHKANASEHQMTAECVADLTLAILGLNDALHGATGLFTYPPHAISLEEFVKLFRARDTQHMVSDRMLSDAYVAIKTSPLTPAVPRHAWRTVSYDARALSEPLRPGVPSLRVRVSLDQPDPDVRICLVGRGLYMDPPVLTFTHAAHSEFTVLATAPGTYDLLFLRTGQHAPMYISGRHHGTQRALPLHLTLSCEDATTTTPGRRTVSLVHLAPGAPRRALTFCMTHQAMAEQVLRCLRTQVEQAREEARHQSQTERDVHALSQLVLESALFSLPASDDTHRLGRSGTMTGASIVRMARENSLLSHVLCMRDRQIVT